MTTTAATTTTHVGMDGPAAGVVSEGAGEVAVGAGSAAGSVGDLTGDDWKSIIVEAPTLICPKVATTSRATQASASKANLERAAGDTVRGFTLSSSSLSYESMTRSPQVGGPLQSSQTHGIVEIIADVASFANCEIHCQHSSFRMCARSDSAQGWRAVCLGSKGD
jgi:hypothetical protein